MIYELWFADSANLINAYDNERDALALVLRNLNRSSEGASTLALTVEDEDGNVTFIAQGQELAERARREFAGHRMAG